MEKQDIHTHHSELISRYLSGNASDAEVQELEAWVLADPQNQEVFKNFKKAWILSGMKENPVSVDVNKNWEQLLGQIEPQAKVLEMKKPFYTQRWLGVAAAVLVLMILSIFLWRNILSSEPYYAQTFDEIEEVQLEDGSTVTLNQRSFLSFANEEKGNIRKVGLKGDAFFDVARDTARPFIIETQNVEIEVLGTSFYVDAREELGEIQVIVESGRVAVRSGGKEEILTANEKAVFTKSNGALDKQENDDANYLSIKDQQLSFEESPLEEVIFALQRQYHEEMEIVNPELMDCPLTANFSKKALRDILDVIEESLGVQAKRERGKIIFKGTCNK
ncbi:MAG: FecR domain-containing protein [Bacteroidia bacterium]|nr:FecR domain-containing protein [Bacteroidia bacterium]